MAVKKSKVSLENTIKAVSSPFKGNLMEKLTPILLVFSMILSFVVGILWEKVSNLEKGGVTAKTTTAAAPVAATLDINTVKSVFDKNVIKFGDKNSKLLIVEVADPSCPFCHVAGGEDAKIAAAMDSSGRFKYVSDGGTYQPPVPEIKKLVDSGKAAFAYVFYPGHGSGEMATKALYCAFDMGKFWQVHDLLMSDAGYAIQNGTDAAGVAAKVVVKNDKTKSAELADFLKSAADPTTMKQCLDSGKYDGRLAEEQTFAGANLMDPQQGGTPTFLVNATRFNGAYSWTDIKSTVDAALK